MGTNELTVSVKEAISVKRRPGRPKLPPGEKMEVLIINVTPEIRRNLDLLSVRCDKSISQLTRSALDLLVFIYDKENPHEQSACQN